VKGVTKIKVSNFGALEHDPATVQTQGLRGTDRHQGRGARLGEPPIVAKTVSIFAAKSAAVDIMCYDHPPPTCRWWRWLAPPDRRDLERPGVWKLYAPPTKKGLTAPDGISMGPSGRSRP